MARERIVEIKHLFDLAEKYIKDVELLRSDVQMPAINELRYAGHHILKAIDEDGNVSDDDIASAKSHCHRAMYEATEAGIMFCLDEIRAFEEVYDDLVIGNVIDNYHELLARAQEAKDLVVVGRADRESVVLHVEQYMEKFSSVREVLNVLKVSRNDLNAMRAQAEEAGRRAAAAKRRDYVRLAMMGLAAVLALITAVYFS